MVYLDLETTGLHAPLEEIVEIAIIDDNGSVLLNTHVRPVRQTEWPDAERIHGISPRDVAWAPTLAQLSTRIQGLLYGREVVIYNAAFDTAFLERELRDAVHIHCCMLAYAEHAGEWSDSYGGYRWHKLVDAADDVRFRWPGKAHSALGDALATRAVWRYLHDEPERARVEQIKPEERALEDEAWAQQRESRQAALRRQRYERRMSRWWLAWWLRTQEPQGWGRRWRHDLEDEYALTFYGATQHVLEQIDRAEQRGLTRYERREEIPRYLVTQAALAKMPIREGWTAPAVAYYVSTTGSRFSLLYDTRGNRLRKPLPEFTYGPIPQGYCTAVQLQKRYGLSAKQIARKRIVGHWRKPYTHEWVSLYRPPPEQVAQRHRRTEIQK